MEILRSPLAHARIKSIDASKAWDIPGVHLVLTGEMMATRNLAWMPTLSYDTQAVLATDKVRFQGQEVACVIADDPYIAKDACEAIDVDYEPLPVIVNPRQAVADDAPVIRDDKESQAGNVIYDWEVGDKAGTDRAFEQADLVSKLQLHYPRESYNTIQVINYILNRDFNQNNRWTKACAIHAAAYLDDFRVSRGLIAQVFNNDRLLQETSAWVIYNKDKKAYEAIRERLPQRDKKFIDSAIEHNALLEGLDDGFFLGIEMVMYLKQLPIFKNIHGTLLSDLSDKIIPVELHLGERYRFNTEDINSPIFIIAHGEVKLKNNDSILTTLKKGSVYGDIFQDGPALAANLLEASERTVLFRINLVDFYFVMANHHDLVQGLIKNITESKLQISQPNS
jgi:hypothetical protein